MEKEGSYTRKPDRAEEIKSFVRGLDVDLVGIADLHSLKGMPLGIPPDAALDVTDPEPLPADHKLLELPNLIIAPHIASATVSSRTLMASRAVQNLVAGLRGEQLPYCVNKQVYG